MLNVNKLVDVEKGLQSRLIFWDQDIYEQEMERIFARCWLFLAHESQLPNVGDFFVTKMGQDEVIVARQRDGSVKAFLNQCRHRGMRLCMAEAGNTPVFTCGYHGWTYGVDGSLRGVPCEKEAYGPEFDKAQWGLRAVAKVESYKGFVFGCMDAAAPALADYLGDAAWYMDIWAGVPGGIEFLGPPSRSIIKANWKTPPDNFIGDSYHVGWTHAASFQAMMGGQMPQVALAGKDAGIQFTTRYGHGAGIVNGPGVVMLTPTCPELFEWSARRAAEISAVAGEAAGKLYPNLWDGTMFPNCSYLIGLYVFKVWHPLGPDKVEIMTWAFAEKEMPADLKRRMMAASHRVFGSAGLLESDDIDNFEYIAQTNRGHVTRRGVMNLQMGMGDEYVDPAYPGVLGAVISETAQRGFYRAWADCMSSGSWAELEAKTATWKEDIFKR